MDRNLTKSVTTGQGDSGDTDVIFLSGINQKHQGLEIETSMKLNDMIRLDGEFHLVIGSLTEIKGNYQENEYNDEGQVIGLKTTPYSYYLMDYG